MSDEIPDAASEAFEQHHAFEPAPDGYRIRTTAFEGTVTASESEEWKHDYTVTVIVPTLDGATAGEVGPAVQNGWLETLERRLQNAPKATRASVELDDFDVEVVGDDVHIRYEFEWGNADRAADIAKTFVEYVEGTYVEGIIPGYEYESPVSDLLASASQSGESGTPL